MDRRRSVVDLGSSVLADCQGACYVRFSLCIEVRGRDGGEDYVKNCGLHEAIDTLHLAA